MGRWWYFSYFLLLIYALQDSYSAVEDGEMVIFFIFFFFLSMLCKTAIQCCGGWTFSICKYSLFVELFAMLIFSFIPRAGLSTWEPGPVQGQWCCLCQHHRHSSLLYQDHRPDHKLLRATAAGLCPSEECGSECIKNMQPARPGRSRILGLGYKEQDQAELRGRLPLPWHHHTQCLSC